MLESMERTPCARRQKGQSGSDPSKSTKEARQTTKAKRPTCKRAKRNVKGRSPNNTDSWLSKQSADRGPNASATMHSQLEECDAHHQP